jgi:hypothetical protein
MGMKILDCLKPLSQDSTTAPTGEYLGSMRFSQKLIPHLVLRWIDSELLC